MIVLSRYVMTFTIAPVDERDARLTVSLVYELPKHRPWRWVEQALAPLYAKWCVDAILSGTRTSLERGSTTIAP